MQLFGPWSARLEYRYTDFGTFTKSFPVTTSCSSCVSPCPGAAIELHPSFHTVRVGLGFSF
jgi:outer membrane immunogenic protein